MNTPTTARPTPAASARTQNEPSPGRRTALLLAVAGVAFIAYPALRPYGPETGVEGARDLASNAWLLAHLLGVLGFSAVAFAMRSTWAWLAVALLLPYYGAEAYGLQSVAQYALDESNPDVLAIADSFRYAAVPVTLFSLGFVALAVAGVQLARGLWSCGTLLRTGGLLAALGLATYLPQFFVGPAGRVGHGVVLGLGLLLVAYGQRRR